MSNDMDLELVGGIYPKAKHDNTPDFVLGRLSINVAQFRDWMKAYLTANPGKEWINIDSLMSKGGKPYAKVDNWEPDSSKAVEPNHPTGAVQPDEDLPF